MWEQPVILGDRDGKRASWQEAEAVRSDQPRPLALIVLGPLAHLDQGAFRVLVTDVYRRRCAVTQERTLPALEAAHIRPYGDGGVHEARNGLLLRRDIHSLFDAGYVTVTPDLRFEVSHRIREEFENGRHYYALHGQPISAPQEDRQRPDPISLSWHNEHCFRG
jgi:putative restriction endonuclease